MALAGRGLRQRSVQVDAAWAAELKSADVQVDESQRMLAIGFRQHGCPIEMLRSDPRLVATDRDRQLRLLRTEGVIETQPGRIIAVSEERLECIAAGR
jgi:hypothetical protein